MTVGVIYRLSMPANMNSAIITCAANSNIIQINNRSRLPKPALPSFLYYYLFMSKSVLDFQLLTADSVYLPGAAEITNSSSAVSLSMSPLLISLSIL